MIIKTAHTLIDSIKDMEVKSITIIIDSSIAIGMRSDRDATRDDVIADCMAIASQSAEIVKRVGSVH